MSWPSIIVSFHLLLKKSLRILRYYLGKFDQH